MLIIASKKELVEKLSFSSRTLAGNCKGNILYGKVYSLPIYKEKISNVFS